MQEISPFVSQDLTAFEHFVICEIFDWCCTAWESLHCVMVSLVLMKIWFGVVFQEISEKNCPMLLSVQNSLWVPIHWFLMATVCHTVQWASCSSKVKISISKSQISIHLHGPVRMCILDTQLDNIMVSSPSWTCLHQHTTAHILSWCPQRPPTGSPSQRWLCEGGEGGRATAETAE